MNNIEFLEKQAIEAAIVSNWEQAIELNKKIIKQEKINIGALLRLAFAYMQMHDDANAKKYYSLVLKHQPTNHIAAENLEKILILEKKKKKKKKAPHMFDPNLFLEIPGKTKTVHLVHLGQKEELAGLTVGQEVALKPKKRKIEIRTLEDEFIGYLPDDISKRLEHFLKEKSIYRAYIKETNLNDVAVFIKEEKKGTKVLHFPSFPQNPYVYMNDINEETADSENASGEHDEDSAEEEWIEMIPTDIEKDEEIISLPHEEDDDSSEE